MKQPTPNTKLDTLADLFPQVGKPGKLLAEYPVLLFVTPEGTHQICHLTAVGRIVHLN